MEWQISTLAWNEIPRIDLHRDRREQRSKVFVRSRRHGFMLLLCGLAAVCLLAPATLTCVETHWSASAIRAQTTKVVAQTSDIASKVASLQTIAQQSRDYREDVAARQSWPSLLTAVAACAPRGVYLSLVTVESNSGQIMISGTAASVTLIDQFVHQMQDSPAFYDTTLAETDLDDDTGSGFRFRLTADAGVGLTPEH